MKYAREMRGVTSTCIVFVLLALRSSSLFFVAALGFSSDWRCWKQSEKVMTSPSTCCISLVADADFSPYFFWSEGIQVCMHQVTPSLFPGFLFALSTLLSRCSAHHTLGEWTLARRELDRLAKWNAIIYPSSSSASSSSFILPTATASARPITSLQTVESV